MVAGNRADAIEDFGAAVFGRREHLQHFATVHVESVQQSSGGYIPQLDAEVDAAGKSVRRIVAQGIVVGI